MLTVPLNKQNKTQHSAIRTCCLLLHSKDKIIHKYTLHCFFMAQQPYWARASSLSRLHDHIQTQNIR